MQGIWLEFLCGMHSQILFSLPGSPSSLFNPILYPQFKFVLVAVIYRSLRNIYEKIMAFVFMF